MDILKQIEEILVLRSPHEKKSKLEQLSDMFEYRLDFDEKDLIEGATILLDAALQEKTSK